MQQTLASENMRSFFLVTAGTVVNNPALKGTRNLQRMLHNCVRMVRKSIGIVTSIQIKEEPPQCVFCYQVFLSSSHK